MRRWALVGPMGVGKSTVGRHVAQCLGWLFADLDEVLVRESGRSIADWFATDGEAAFRRWEATCLARMTHHPEVEANGLVLATGGGTVLLPENRALLRMHWCVIYLTARWEVLVRRLEEGREGRPLLAGADWQERLRNLLAVRDPLYREVACAVVDVSDLSPGDAAAAVWAALSHCCRNAAKEHDAGG